MLNYRLIDPPLNELTIDEILKNRGIDDVTEYKNPTQKSEIPFSLLDNIYDAATMYIKHLKKGSKIAYIVDSDADGFTSSAILIAYTKRLFPDLQYEPFIHEHKAHGLEDMIERLEDGDHDLIILPDAGSYDKEYMERLILQNKEVIVLDHHAPLYDDDGNIHMYQGSGAVIVNNQLSEKYSNKSLCGAGVTYKFCQCLDELFNVQYANDFIDLLSVGEVSDVMSQTYPETRYYIIEGLKHIKNRGLIGLINAQSYTLQNKAEPPYRGLTPIDVAFRISPLINAITRVGTMLEKETLFNSLSIEEEVFVKSKKRGANDEMVPLADEAARMATNARTRQNRICEKSFELLDARAHKNDLLENKILFIPIEEEDEIPSELTGLIAQQFVSKYGRPCMLGRINSKEEWKGSIRSNENFRALPSFKKYLEESGYFDYVAGHASAAGFGINNSRVDKLIKKSNKDFTDKDFDPTPLADTVINAKDNNLLSLGYSIAVDCENCFGNGVKEPTFVINGIDLKDVLLMGKEKDSTKITCNGQIYVRFKDKSFADLAAANKTAKINVYGRFSRNDFQGKTIVQFIIDNYEFEYRKKYEF